MKITFDAIKWLIFQILIGVMIVSLNFSKACPEDKVTWTLILFIGFIIVTKFSDDEANK